MQTDTGKVVKLGANKGLTGEGKPASLEGEHCNGILARAGLHPCLVCNQAEEGYSYVFWQILVTTGGKNARESSLWLIVQDANCLWYKKEALALVLYDIYIMGVAC